MSAIDDLPPLREVIRQHALSARKSLGQNFLLDLNLTARIARAAGPLEDATIIEIGPPQGPTMLLPFTNAVVPSVDIKGGRVVIELPDEIDGDDPSSAGA